MPYACTEDWFVEPPALGLFVELDWTTIIGAPKSPPDARPAAAASVVGAGGVGTKPAG